MKEAYKLVRLRKNGTISPLFVDSKAILPVGKWIKSKAIRAKGFKFRPGWHCCETPFAPHLSKKGRVWCKIQIKGYKEHHRPKYQGGLWYTANQMKILEILHEEGKA